MIRCLYGIGLALLSGICLAQDIPQHRLRLLAVGSPPPFVQEVRDGARYEVAAPEGSIPPRTVKLTNITETDENSGAKTPALKLRLGQISAPVSFSLPEAERVTLESDAGKKWLDVPLQKSAASLAIIWRGGKDWNEARTLVVPDDAPARAEGNVHFVNLTASPLAVVIGDEKIRLNPGKTFQRALSTGTASTPVEISYPLASGVLKRCHSASLDRNRGNFHRILIYAADGKKPRMPVKVLQLEEPS